MGYTFTKDIVLDDEDIEEILTNSGYIEKPSDFEELIASDPDLQHLIAQADLETHQTTLPPRTRELLERLTGKQFGI